MKENLFFILNTLLTHNGIYLDRQELKLQLLSHPSYPSLYSVVDVLDYYSVDNLAVNLPVNEETMEALPDSFITHLNTNDDLVLVEKKKEGFKITDNTKSTSVLTHESFASEWSGVMLAVEKDDELSGNKDIARHIHYLYYVLIAAVLGFFIFSNDSSLFALTHFALSLVGLTLSVLILKTEIGIPSLAADSICNFAEEKDCGAVLNSAGATLFGGIKLSDLCLLAFGTYSLTWFFYFLNGVSHFMPIVGMSLLALPFSVYSIYYQSSVLKKWCPLCLGIVAIMLLQAVAVLLAGDSAFLFSTNSLLLWLLSFLLTISVGAYLLSSYKRKNTLENKEIDYYRFKRNPSLFQTLYSHSKPIKATGEITGEIVLGNPNADFSIIMITNPLCTFCREAHKHMMALLYKDPEAVKLIVRFYVNIDKKESEPYQIASELLRMYQTSDMETIIEALDVVYHSHNSAIKWLRKNQPSSSDSAYDSILQKQRNWCKDNELAFTPNLVVNGKQYPRAYESGDLFYFMDELVEASESA